MQDTCHCTIGEKKCLINQTLHLQNRFYASFACCCWRCCSQASRFSPCRPKKIPPHHRRLGSSHRTARPLALRQDAIAFFPEEGERRAVIAGCAMAVHFPKSDAPPATPFPKIEAGRARRNPHQGGKRPGRADKDGQEDQKHHDRLYQIGRRWNLGGVGKRHGRRGRQRERQGQCTPVKRYGVKRHGMLPDAFRRVCLGPRPVPA